MLLKKHWFKSMHGVKPRTIRVGKEESNFTCVNGGIKSGKANLVKSSEIILSGLAVERSSRGMTPVYYD